MKTTKLDVFPSDKAFQVIVEPWGHEFPVVPGERYAVLAQHPTVEPTLIVDLVAGSLVVLVNTVGATFSFLQGDRVEFQTDNAIPPVS